MDDNKYKCVYCASWIASPIKKDMSENGKKTSKTIKRKCITRKRFIGSDSESCKYFSPAEIIHCDAGHMRMNLLNCLQRRRNPKKYKAWMACSKCRQFDRDLSSIIEDYYLNTKKVVAPEEKTIGRKLKRRETPHKKRQIKRRKKSNLEKGLDILLPKTRKIKRRKKKRKIKRR